MVSQADIARKIAVFQITDDIERRAPYPGQRYRHGWIPVGRADWPDDIPEDEDLVSREGGKWFHEEGYLTDDYVEQYGTPETYSNFGFDRSGNYSVVLSRDGKIHIAYDRPGGPRSSRGETVWQRDASDVRFKGMTPDAARSLAADIEWASERSTASRRPVDPQTGEAGGDEDFGAGQSRRNEATGLIITSGRNGGVVISGMGKNGTDLKLSEGDAIDMEASLTSIAEAS